ncbi:VTC domain-containing protein [Anaerorhabdus sp.]|jgi:hypothetical protein|uniref:VTC domain-containing protein n=1 Tax=Anaerorhabdus sp. TaxID=1872524 RepID=UPI002FCC9E6E
MRNVSSSNQVQQKYLIKEGQVKKFMECLSNKIEEDEHFKYTVYNIYYEPVSETLISKVYKSRIPNEIIRLRSYGIPQISDPVYIEIKETKNEETHKQRLELTLDEAYELLCKQHDCGDNQIDELLRNSGLLPKLFVGYERVAYCSKFNPKVRLTFSMNIRYRFEDFRLCDLSKNIQLFNDDSILLEVSGESLPEWLTNAIKICNFKPIQHKAVFHKFKQYEEQLKLSSNYY